jgi:hypothetical protein
MVSSIMSLIHRVLRYVRSVLAMFILTRILGWRVKRDISVYDAYRKGRFVAIYLHTSLYDHLIGVLFSYALNLQFITIGAYRSNKNTQTTGVRYLLYNLFDTIVVDLHKDRKTTCEAIIRDLKERDDFIFSIYPEGSVRRTAGLKSAFYKVAQKTRADILMFDLDYHNHEAGLRSIIDHNIVSVSPSRRILEIATEEMVKTVPFDATRTYLMNAVHLINQPTVNEEGSSDFDVFANSDEVIDPDTGILIKGRPTSLLDMNRSWLRFTPFLTVLTIAISIILKFFY